MKDEQDTRTANIGIPHKEEKVPIFLKGEREYYFRTNITSVVGCGQVPDVAPHTCGWVEAWVSSHLLPPPNNPQVPHHQPCPHHPRPHPPLPSPPPPASRLPPLAALPSLFPPVPSSAGQQPGRP